MNYEFEMAWASIYNTFDEAFDYRGKPFYIDSESAVIVDGTTYYSAPF
jgi:Fe-S cluster assembly iron-binding protein IscA